MRGLQSSSIIQRQIPSQIPDIPGRNRPKIPTIKLRIRFFCQRADPGNAQISHRRINQDSKSPLSRFQVHTRTSTTHASKLHRQLFVQLEEGRERVPATEAFKLTSESFVLPPRGPTLLRINQPTLHNVQPSTITVVVSQRYTQSRLPSPPTLRFSSFA